MLDMAIGRITALFVVCVGVSGCVQDESVARVDSAYGRVLFLDSCSDCHGRDARGGGPASLGLGDPPPSLTTLARQNHGQYPRDYVMQVIDGLDRSTDANSAMPEFGADDLGPMIRVEEDHYTVSVPSDLLALASYLESIQE